MSGFPTNCVIWPGRCDRDGYGILSVGGHRKAHRFIYALYVGPIPAGMGVLHSCDTPSCVNPAHLRIGSPADNADDRKSRFRSCAGTLSPKAKLTAEQVMRIRDGMTLSEATASLGIRKSAFYAARNGETYRQVSRSGRR